MQEKHVHTVLGPSAGIMVTGPATVFAATVFDLGADGAVEFQVEIAGDWVGMGVLEFPRHIIPAEVRTLEFGRYAFDFMALSGNHSYRWEAVRLVAGTITTYIVA